MNKLNLKLINKSGSLILLVLIVSVVLMPVHNSRADMAPSYPECTDTTSAIQDKNGNWKEIPVEPTCGYLEFSASFNLGQYKDKFVIIETTHVRYGDDENKISSGNVDMSYNYSESKTVVAIDKDYFNAKKDLDGIFNYTIIPNDEFGDYQTIEPKNPKELSEHSYTFIVSKDDELFGAPQSDKIINSKYIELAQSSNPYLETSNLKCGTDIKCVEDVIYVPQSISDHYIILTKGKVTYNPNTIGQSITYPIYNQQAESLAVKSLWQRFLTWFSFLF